MFGGLVCWLEVAGRLDLNYQSFKFIAQAKATIAKVCVMQAGKPSPVKRLSAHDYSNT